MDSSDDDFVWSSASSDTDDNITVLKMKDKYYDEESESGKSYKKKLQKQLFRERDSSVKREPESDCDTTRPKHKHKHRAENGAHEELHDDSYLALRVKQEQAFLVPSPHKVKATKHSHDSDTNIDSTNNDSEYPTTKKSKKSKKKKRNSDVNDETDNKNNLSNTSTESPSPKKKKSKKRKDSECTETFEVSVEGKSSDAALNLSSTPLLSDDVAEIQTNVTTMESLSESLSPKKKKSKKRRQSDSTDTYGESEMIIEDKFSAEETEVETRPENKKRSKPNGTDNEDGSHLKDRSRNSIIKSSTFTSKEFISEESSDDDAEKSQHKTSQPSANNSRWETKADNNTQQIYDTSVPDRSHRTTNISDRIQFEDDDTTDMDTSQIVNENTKQSSTIRQFLSAHPHLQALTYKLQGDSFITPDDELWILNCPHELDITTLKGTDVLLDTDGKCRIKVDGQTYNGTLDNDNNRITLLSLEHNKTIIKNVPVTGTVHFRKRIPKAHFMEDNMIKNNQTNFIPLPETKCRHPLFGNNYKTAMKIPASIKDRLNCTETVELPEKRKKKKHKKERMDPMEELEPVPASLHSKKRKHKHTDTEEPTAKKKRIKNDMSSADAWDSEKAIEENLFNF